MSLRRKMLDEDMRSVLGEIGEDVAINGQNLKAAVGEISEGIEPFLEGYSLDTAASFTFRRTDFNTLPKAQDTITYDGTIYRIVVPVKTPLGGSVVCECGAESA